MVRSANFCDRCGAAIPDQTITCPVCGEIQANVHALAPLIPPKKRNNRPAPSALLMQRYQIIEQIGQGGFGVVYTAWDRKQRRTVAIKQITLADLSTREIIDATDSYNRETTILPPLEHRNLPHLYDHFTDPEHWYIVMEYIKGQTLEELLAKEQDGRLPIERVLKIGKKLCLALAYLHAQEQPIIFRDVKPGNIMVTKWGHIYLIDFGIARRYRPEKTRDTGALGSPGYAAPEQYGSAQSTIKTDLYGLGATLQTMLTGKEPSESADIHEEAEVPDALKMLITEMLERDPNLRPRNMIAVRDTLTNIQRQVKKEKKQIVSPFAWLGALWTILCIGIANASFPSNINFSIFFIMVSICCIYSCIYYLYKERLTLSQRLSRKEIFMLINKGLQRTIRGFLSYFYLELVCCPFFGMFLHTSYNVLLLFIWAGGCLFVLDVLPRLVEWIQIVKNKASKKQKVQASVQQQQTLRP
ncbi:MAG TPA: serine/threonine-protein kinase [Ktedonobacteraceae bacterium]|jgi:serine/threonine protein kinase|nr:serine/threonine-protein kinase [Ktedonobacteraceae bacterium]